MDEQRRWDALRVENEVVVTTNMDKLANALEGEPGGKVGDHFMIIHGL